MRGSWWPSCSSRASGSWSWWSSAGRASVPGRWGCWPSSAASLTRRGTGLGAGGIEPPGGFEPRYVTLASPLGCTLYFVWDLYGGTPALRRLVPLGLLATMLVVLWPNTQAGIAAGKELAEAASRFEREVRSGTPMYLVIKHATPFLHPSEDELTALLPTLRDSGVGLFRHLRPDPNFREVACPWPLQRSGWPAGSGTAHVTGVDPGADLRPRRGASCRGHPHPLRTRQSRGHAGPVPDALARPRSASRLARSRLRELESPHRARSDDDGLGRRTIREFRVQPDNQPCEFRIESITLLIPPG